MKILNLKSRILNPSSGFTLPELIVTITIISLMATTLLIDRHKYSDALVIKSQAYVLAGYIRQAQAYTLGARAKGNSFETPYGIYLNESEPSQFIFFADNDADGKYDGGAETLEIKQITDKIVLNKICATYTNGTERCTSPDPRRFTVTFTRPEPNAILKFFNSSNQLISSANLNSPARIHLVSPQGSRRIILIGSTGQVSIE